MSKIAARRLTLVFNRETRGRHRLAPLPGKKKNRLTTLLAINRFCLFGCVQGCSVGGAITAPHVNVCVSELLPSLDSARTLPLSTSSRSVYVPGASKRFE